MSQIQVITSDVVQIDITNSGNDTVCWQKRFPKNITIGDFKSKLEMITGATSSAMELQLLSRENKLIGYLDNNEALLGSYPIDNGMVVHVIGNFTNILENCEKFTLSPEEYAKRTNTVHSFLKNNKLGKYDDEQLRIIEERKKMEQIALDEKLESITIGARCQVQVKGQPCRKGTVMYKGEVDGLQGKYVGVRYDEPLGKNDGSFKGKKYFECDMKYGGFVIPSNVEIGDFPEDDLDFEEI